MAGHKFNPDKAFILNNPIRKLMLSPEKVFKDIYLIWKETWSDIGCDMDRWALTAGLSKSTAWQWSRSIIGWKYTKSFCGS